MVSTSIKHEEQVERRHVTVLGDTTKGKVHCSICLMYHCYLCRVVLVCDGLMYHCSLCFFLQVDHMGQTNTCYHVTEEDNMSDVKVVVFCIS